MRPPIAALESWTDLNEHVTPQFYLREFRDPGVPDAGGPSIWVADFRESQVELQAVKSLWGKRRL